jgi:hypothetical protein
LAGFRGCREMKVFQRIAGMVAGFAGGFIRETRRMAGNRPLKKW